MTTQATNLRLRPTARIDWFNLPFLVVVHAIAVVGIVYMAAVQFSWWTVGLALLWFVLSGLSITAGYHRLYSHRAYRASGLLRAFCLFFGAAGVQNSALKWAGDHRRHHAKTDTDGDPYNIRRGFWWAHIGWVACRDTGETLENVHDLEQDRLVAFQHNHYLFLAILAGAIVPAALGALWGDAWGGLLVAGFLRLCIQWHATFSINSLAHMAGTQPYSKDTTARDSFWTALISFGEGYHNFHHRFQLDYRCGIRWHHVDPTKWFIWTASKVGLARDLRRTSEERIQRAREALVAAASNSMARKVPATVPTRK